MQKGDPTTTATSARPTRAQRFVRLACRTYLLCVLCVWAFIAFTADRWWLGTAAMFAPVWVWPLPLILLIPLAAILNRKALWPLAIAALIVLFPLGRFNIPWRAALPSPTASALPAPIKVITLNADQDELDVQAFARFVNQSNPDLVVLQGWHERFSKPVFPDGWHVRRFSALCLASRFPILDARRCDGPDFPPFRDHPGNLAVYKVAAPGGPIHVVDFHLATARDGLAALLHRALREAAKDLSDNIRIRRDQTLAARRVVDELTGPTIVAGDFNTPTTSALYRQSWSDLTNAFSQRGWGFGNTHFTSHTAVRIDHILVGPGWRVDSCQVGPNVGPGHRPVIAAIAWVGP